MNSRKTGSTTGSATVEKPMQGWLLINGERVPIPEPTAYQQRIRTLLDWRNPPSATTQPLEQPTIRATRHPSSCICETCWNAGQYYADYLQQKQLNEL
jgi:hypothetical protein